MQKTDHPMPETDRISAPHHATADHASVRTPQQESRAIE